jgi:hypothetical protein
VRGCVLSPTCVRPIRRTALRYVGMVFFYDWCAPVRVFGGPFLLVRVCDRADLVLLLLGPLVGLLFIREFPSLLALHFCVTAMSSLPRAPFATLNGSQHTRYVQEGFLEDVELPTIPGLSTPRQTSPVHWQPVLSTWSFGTAVPASSRDLSPLSAFLAAESRRGDDAAPLALGSGLPVSSPVHPSSASGSPDAEGSLASPSPSRSVTPR